METIIFNFLERLIDSSTYHTVNFWVGVFFGILIGIFLHKLCSRYYIDKIKAECERSLIEAENKIKSFKEMSDKEFSKRVLNTKIDIPDDLID